MVSLSLHFTWHLCILDWVRVFLLQNRFMSDIAVVLSCHMNECDTYGTCAYVSISHNKAVERIQITIVLVIIFSRYWFKSIIRTNVQELGTCCLIIGEHISDMFTLVMIKTYAWVYVFLISDRSCFIIDCVSSILGRLCFFFKKEHSS